MPVTSDRKFSVMASTLPFKDREQAQYIQRVACRDCPSFRTHSTWDEGECLRVNGMKLIAKDGSSFCHLHPALAHIKE